MRNKKINQNNTGVIEHDWNHHCLNLECGYIWDTDDLHETCPKCGGSEHETLSHLPELERWDCNYPGDWQDAVELQEAIESGKCQVLPEEKLEEQYADMLDECCPPFKCGRIEYAASATLKLVDEIAYDLGLSEYIDRDWKEHPYRRGYYISKQI